MRNCQRDAVHPIAFAVGLVLASAVSAAETTTQPKLLVTQTTLSTGAALQAAQAAFESCSSKGYTVSVAVVDRSGTLLSLLRDNLAGAHTVSTSIGRAESAARAASTAASTSAARSTGSHSSGNP